MLINKIITRAAGASVAAISLLSAQPLRAEPASETARIEKLERAVELLEQRCGLNDSLTLAIEITDSNAAFFDAANGFRGCIAGIHEVLRRQGLLAGRWCLNPREDLSPGQMEEIDRVYRAYPHLNDDEFVRQHLDEWLK